MIGTTISDLNTIEKLFMKTKKLFNYNPLDADVAALLFRLIFGGMFVYYGYQKVSMYDQILPMFGDLIGIGAKVSLHLVIFAELVCGFLVLIGCVTRLSALPIFITMVIAYFIAHAKDPFEVKQLAFIYLLLSIVVFVMGSGKYSVDALLQSRRYTNTLSHG